MRGPSAVAGFLAEIHEQTEMLTGRHTYIVIAVLCTPNSGEVIRVLWRRVALFLRLFLRLAVLIEHRLVMDGQTDGQRNTGPQQMPR